MRATTLLLVHFRSRVRAWRLRRGIGLRALQMALVFYVAGIAIYAGRHFDVLTMHVLGLGPPLSTLHAHAGAVLTSLFLARFMFQGGDGFPVQALLRLPVTDRRLIRVHLTASLATLHNVLPLAFLVPFWWWHVAPWARPAASAAWLTAWVALVAASHAATILLRALLGRRRRAFWLGVGLFASALAADYALGQTLAQSVSRVFFDLLILAPLAPTALCVVAAVGVWTAAARTVRSGLRQVSDTRARGRAGARSLAAIERLGPAGRLLALELRMIWRCRRPRHYLLVSLLFSTAYLLFLLLNPLVYSGVLFGAIIGLFASGGFALNYGQLMFSWDSGHFDGLLARDLRATSMVRAKLALLQGSCALLFVLSAPLFAFLRPDLLTLHIAFGFYNTGVTCALVMLLALSNRRRVDVTESGGLFNYQGFSAAHWYWIVPVAAPPTIVLHLMRDTPATALAVVAGLGVIGIVAFPLWARAFASLFTRRRLTMAAGFRVDESA